MLQRAFYSSSDRFVGKLIVDRRRHSSLVRVIALAAKDSGRIYSDQHLMIGAGSLSGRNIEVEQFAVTRDQQSLGSDSLGERKLPKVISGDRRVIQSFKVSCDNNWARERLAERRGLFGIHGDRRAFP